MLQAFFENAWAESDIDQDACLFAFDIDGIALTAAGEYRKLKNGFPLSYEKQKEESPQPPLQGGAGHGKTHSFGRGPAEELRQY
jgi:hypothetical protein